MLNDAHLRLLALALRRYGAHHVFNGLAFALRRGYEARPAVRVWAELERHACVARSFNDWGCMSITEDGAHEVEEWLRRRRAARRERAPATPPPANRGTGDAVTSRPSRRGPYCPTCGAPRRSSRPDGVGVSWWRRVLRAFAVGRLRG